MNVNPGVSIELTGDEVATAIDAYLVAHNIHIQGPRTITVNGKLCEAGRVYVDPSGYAIIDGERVPKTEYVTIIGTRLKIYGA